MNEEKAKEIEGKYLAQQAGLYGMVEHKEIDEYEEIIHYVDYKEAKGFLEGLKQGREEEREKAKVLEDQVKHHAADFTIGEGNEFVGCARCKEALAQYEESK